MASLHGDDGIRDNEGSDFCIKVDQDIIVILIVFQTISSTNTYPLAMYTEVCLRASYKCGSHKTRHDGYNDYTKYYPHHTEETTKK